MRSLCHDKRIHWVCYDLKPLSKYRAGFLMENAIDQLARKRLLNNVILHGMGNRTWRGIIRNSVTAMKERYGLEIDLADIQQSSTLNATLKDCLDSEQVLLTHIKGVYNHYTVIVGYTECNWVLFDSDGLKYVRQKSVKASFERKCSRHSFAKNGIIAMRFIG